MQSLRRLLIWLSLTWTAGVFCSPIALAQTRAQQERRLTELEERFERLIELEEWQDDRRSELETLLREAHQEMKSLSSANAELREQIAGQEAVINQLRCDQGSLRQRTQAMESASRSAPPPPLSSTASAAYKVAALRIVPPADH